MVFKGLLQTSIPPLISTFCPKVQLCLGTEKFPWGTLVFQKCYCVQFFWTIWVSRFCRCFCLTLPNVFVEEPFCVSECLVNRKILSQRGEHHDFVSKKCCFTVTKKIVWNNSVYRQTSGIGKPLCTGGITTFRWKLLSHSAEKKIRRRTFLCMTRFLLSKNFIDKRGREGVSQFSV